jgi:rieske iron-sulfur protein
MPGRGSDGRSSAEGGCGTHHLQNKNAPELAPLARRELLLTALAAGLASALTDTAVAGDPKAMRPQEGDQFVYVSGDKKGEVVAPADLVDKPPVLAWPMEPEGRVVRSGSRLNQVLLVHVGEDGLDDETRPRAAGGVVAYSASCTHALCPVTGWKAEEKVLKCHCHNSEYDARLAAKVVFGPAPRPLPALPLRLADGALVAAGEFIGRVGHASGRS